MIAMVALVVPNLSLSRRFTKQKPGNVVIEESRRSRCAREGVGVLGTFCIMLRGGT